MQVVVGHAAAENGPGRGPSPAVWSAILAEVGPEVDGLPEYDRLGKTFADPVYLGAAEDNSVLDGVSIPVDPAAVRISRQGTLASSGSSRPSTDRPAGRAGIGDARPSGRPVTSTLRSAPDGTARTDGTAATDGQTLADGPGGTPPTDIAAAGAARSRRRRWMPLLAAAVIGVVAGGGVVALVGRDSTDSGPDVLASTQLTPVPGGQLGDEAGKDFGVAEVVFANGTQWVKVSGASLPPTSDSYEVWLIGQDKKMVSLGALHDGAGTFTIPAGIDYTQFPVVDISAEPPDGVPTHSGDSLVRGTL
nr:anti-sigma factor [Nakamurella flavida]